MKKAGQTKQGMILLLAVLLILAWYMTISSWMGNADKVAGAVEAARQYEEKELYLDAIEAYQEALSYAGSDETIELCIANNYKKLGNKKEYQKQLNKIIKSYAPDTIAVDVLYQDYMKNNKQQKAVELICGLHEAYPEAENIEKYYVKVQGMYQEGYNAFEELGNFFHGYAICKAGEKYGVIDANGEIYLNAEYDSVSLPDEKNGMSVVVDEAQKQTYLVDKEGQRVAVADDYYEYAGGLSDNRIPVRKDGKYGYLDNHMQEKVEADLEDATGFYEKIAAVKRNGAWTVVNRKMEDLCGTTYEDIKCDEAGICSRNEVIWVKEGGNYRLIDKKGNEISDNRYQDVEAFLSNQPGAVCRDGKWGFMSLDGEEVIRCQFQEAKSFRLGLAAVKQNGAWGYINEKGEQIIESVFEQAGSFNENGSAPVMIDGVWRVITLDMYR